MKLYTNPLSPNCRRVALVIAHLGIRIDQEYLDLSKREQNTPEFMAINPNGQVPVLVSEDMALFESNAIAAYLCDVARAQGNPKAEQLLPSDLRRRADVMRWQCWQLAKLDLSVMPLGFEGFIKPVFLLQQPNREKLDAAIALFRKHAAVLEFGLGDRDWLVGEHLTLADYAVAVCMQAAPAAPFPLGDFPVLEAWLDRVRDQPAWHRTQARMD